MQIITNYPLFTTCSIFRSTQQWCCVMSIHSHCTHRSLNLEMASVISVDRNKCLGSNCSLAELYTDEVLMPTETAKLVPYKGLRIEHRQLYLQSSPVLRQLRPLPLDGLVSPMTLPAASLLVLSEDPYPAILARRDCPSSSPPGDHLISRSRQVVKAR